MTLLGVATIGSGTPDGNRKRRPSSPPQTRFHGASRLANPRSAAFRAPRLAYDFRSKRRQVCIRVPALATAARPMFKRCHRVASVNPFPVEDRRDADPDGMGNSPVLESLGPAPLPSRPASGSLALDVASASSRGREEVRPSPARPLPMTCLEPRSLLMRIRASDAGRGAARHPQPPPFHSACPLGPVWGAALSAAPVAGWTSGAGGCARRREGPQRRGNGNLRDEWPVDGE